MSIYNKTWNVDEEITSDKLNQMAADIGNSTNPIHPQYSPLCYQKSIQFIGARVTGSPVSCQHYQFGNEVDYSVVIDGAIFYNISAISRPVGVLRFKHLSGMPTNVIFKIELNRDVGSSATYCKARFVVTKNGTNINNTSDTPVGTASWTAYTKTISLSTPAAGDIIEAWLVIACDALGAGADQGMNVRRLEMYLG
jgi:hypothetical protein